MQRILFRQEEYEDSSDFLFYFAYFERLFRLQYYQLPDHIAERARTLLESRCTTTLFIIELCSSSSFYKIAFLKTLERIIMPTEYKCCLCQAVSANCTRKCLICASGEKRICNTCLARHNKCSECRGETTAAVAFQDSSKKSAPKRKKSVEQATSSASAVNAVDTTAHYESSTSSLAEQAVIVTTSPTTAAKNSASALSEIKKKQDEAAALALGQEMERTKAASVAATLQQEVDSDRTIAQIAAQRQQEQASSIAAQKHTGSN